MKWSKLVILSTVLLTSLSFSQVNINTASLAELSALPGIGEVKAKAILKYRKANGKFKSAKELSQVKGIGEKTVSNLGSNVKTSGATDLSKLSKATKAKSTKAKSTKAKSTKAKSTKAKSTKAKSTKAKSTKAKAIKPSKKSTKTSN